MLRPALHHLIGKRWGTRKAKFKNSCDRVLFKLFGQRTGLSPVAVVLSTLFWTLLWGPVGLLLATPLTVCLVVLGKHTEGLKFIDILLGDDPPLLPEERFYQRLLAGDATEAADQAEEELKTHTLSAYYDAVPMKALILAQADAADGKLNGDRQETIRTTMNEIIEDLEDYQDSTCNEPTAMVSEDERISGKDEVNLPGEPLTRAPYFSPVLCVASRSRLDQTAASMLSQVLIKRGLAAVSLPYERAVESQLPLETRTGKMVCLSYFGADSKPAHVRYLIRRLRRLMPRAKFVACFWLLRDDSVKLEEWRAIVNADFAVASLEEAAATCCAEMHSAAPRLVS